MCFQLNTGLGGRCNKKKAAEPGVVLRLSAAAATAHFKRWPTPLPMPTALGLHVGQSKSCH